MPIYCAAGENLSNFVSFSASRGQSETSFHMHIFNEKKTSAKKIFHPRIGKSGSSPSYNLGWVFSWGGGALDIWMDTHDDPGNL